MINIIDPYWWNLGPVPVRNEGLPRIDIGGIYKLSTNAVACILCSRYLLYR